MSNNCELNRQFIYIKEIFTSEKILLKEIKPSEIELQ